MRNTNNPRIHWAWWVLAIALLLAWRYWPHAPLHGAAPPVVNGPVNNRTPVPTEYPSPASNQSPPDAGLPAFLPAEARETIALIQRGGPFTHPQDGSVFGNREGHLPRKPRGWYHEYTVETPGLSHRGSRRIITGGNPPTAWYYTSDHYDSFRAFDPGPASGALR
ncbi:MAG: ribonuclease domain-containing protein [Thermomonas sp.]